MPYAGSMEWDQVWAWIGNEIAEFGVRWILVGLAMLAFGGFIGRRYTEMKRRVAALETTVSEDRGTTVIHGNVHIVSDPPDIGDVNKIITMTQAEYDALPAKEEKTLYLIANRKNG